MSHIVRALVDSISGRKAKITTHAGESQEEVLMLTPVGMSVGGGTEGIVFAVNGDPSRRAIVPFDPSAPVAAEGELLLFNPGNSDFQISLTDDGLTIKGDIDKIKIGDKRIAVVGDMTSSGGEIVRP